MTQRRIWGSATAWLERTRRLPGIDLVLILSLAGLLYGGVSLSHEWTGELRPAIDINLHDPWVLVTCTFYSLSRGLIAFVFSLLFTLVYGYWAAKDPLAERVLVPLLDILQSIPVLSFLPGLVLALVYLFPTTNVGLELAAILMIFTGQAWNMTFSFYHSLRSIPQDQREVATIYGFSWWQRLRWVEVPFSTMGLVWNGMMSMAGGWFFLMVNEAFQLRKQDFRLPGLGSYMSVANETGDMVAMVWAIVAMTAMIVLLDQLFWRPVVVWAQKFRVEEGGQQAEMKSWFLSLLSRSRLIARVRAWYHRDGARIPAADPPAQPPTVPLAKAGMANPGPGEKLAVPSSDPKRPSLPILHLLPRLFFVLLLLVLVYGAWLVLGLLWEVTAAEWLDIFGAACMTLGRVLLTMVLGTLWAVPAGLAIGLSPRLSRIVQPIVQVLASFPAPMLFYFVLIVTGALGISLGWSSILLMLLGTQWYILFNVTAGAMAIPADLTEAGTSFRITGWQRWWTLYLPAVFPYLVTGWVTAAGGAWNTSIVAEYVDFRKQTVQTWGLGSLIHMAPDEGKFGLLAAATLVMSTIVVGFNRTLWRRLYRLAEERFSLNK